MVLVRQIYRVSERLSVRVERFLDGSRHNEVRELTFECSVDASGDPNNTLRAVRRIVTHLP